MKLSEALRILSEKDFLNKSKMVAGFKEILADKTDTEVGIKGKIDERLFNIFEAGWSKVPNGADKSCRDLLSTMSRDTNSVICTEIESVVWKATSAKPKKGDILKTFYKFAKPYIERLNLLTDIIDTVKKLDKRIETEANFTAGFGINQKNIYRLQNAFHYYVNFFSALDEVFNYINIGDDQEKAIPQIVKLAKSIKGVSQYGRSGTFYDAITEKDILKQIEDFKGVVRVNGSLDMYVQFRDGKILRIYW